MSGNLLVINVDIREIRVALIERGIIAELHIERLSSRSTLGNVVLGKVSRVLPGMQAAFIDIGEERAAFLHVEDLIRPDDFEAYLGGAHRQDDGAAAMLDDASPDAAPVADEPEAESNLAEPAAADAAPGVVADEQPAAGSSDPAAAGADAASDSADSVDVAPDSADSVDVVPDSPDSIEVALDSADSADAASDSADSVDVAPDSPDSVDVALDWAEGTDEPSEPAAGSEAPADSDEALGAAKPEAVAAVVASSAADVVARPAPDGAEHSDHGPPLAGDGREGSVSAAVSPSAGAAAAASAAAAAAGTVVAASDGGADEAVAGRESAGRPRGRRARVRRSSRTTGGKREARATGGKREARADGGKREARGHGRRRGAGKTGAGGNGRKRTRGRAADRSRISKNTPIREVVREGQQVIVQVTKEPIGTKGARVSSHVSLPGRYVVYLPTVDTVGISKRIGSDRERARLREAIDSVKPPTGGLVVRTVAEGLTKKHLKTDVGYLVSLWDEIAKKRDAAAAAPCMLYEELDLVLKTARDLLTEDVERIIIDNREQYARLRRFVSTFMPDRVGDIQLYEGREPVFDAYGIEDEIGRALSRKVPLPSGGHLIIDQAEALTAIDVNTGRFVGKGSRDVEDTILATNLEAVAEIAYQLRFRNIGGLIVLDLIDMERASNRRRVRRELESLLAHDKAKTTLNRISDLGLIEMTRKRTRESLARLLHEPCFYCDGTGQLMSRETIAYEILRQIRREQSNLRGYQITVNAHPAVIDLLEHVEQVAVEEVERMFARRIKLVAHDTYHIEQFDLQGI